MARRKKVYWGEEVTDIDLQTEVLDKSQIILDSLYENFWQIPKIDNNYHQYIQDEDYFLIYNRIILKGKKVIKKRVVRTIKGKEFLQKIDKDWMPGDEPNLILRSTSSWAWCTSRR